MYTLYHDKNKRQLKVQKAKPIFLQDMFTDEVTVYNGNYFFCNNRKPLVDRAREIKAEWLAELEDQLNTVENIKV